MNCTQDSPNWDNSKMYMEIVELENSCLQNSDGNINNGGYPYLISQQQPKTCSSSDSGASSGDTDFTSNTGHLSQHEFNTDRMHEDTLTLSQSIHRNYLPNSNSYLTTNEVGSNQGRSQLPGAWFYEMGPHDDDVLSQGNNSPINELEDFNFQQQLRLNISGVRNITETVNVPSSEHVAEIVGRQGCKIKALRAKTNTYIKTPVRGEDPIFIVTGRPEDVFEAKTEIELAAEHFTQIRASRRHSQGGAPAPGHVTAYVRVPLRVVGLVVGPKGATIKRIQQDTHTYIITPSREREPVFEVTGLPQNVESARHEIEQHIYERTGNMPITDTTQQLGSMELQSTLAAAAISAHLGSLNLKENRPTYGSLAPASQIRQQLAVNSGLFDINNVFGDFPRNGTDINLSMLGLNGMRNGGLICKQGFSNDGSSLTNNSQPFYNPIDVVTGSQVVGNNSGGSLISPMVRNNSVQTSSIPSTGSSPTDNSFNPWNGPFGGMNNCGVVNNTMTQESISADGSINSAVSSFGGSFGCGQNSSASSTGSRDEGLSESPTNGFDGGNKDHFEIMSLIWNDKSQGIVNNFPTNEVSLSSA
ncbi:K Homology domain and K Homology domain, type 1-containing protein [Strongyloides ratti]|uniref:K Homology domain and K Homology domain, type 1-containing protein n=1 Tax=Strongyloides ratti TaxID=34506 RepID=A0A090MXL3_STRRB|nr:K Homology domain and K Homology domain, type 1-containing protein [Strongyloides ratti]CEF65634.1 K Homology domain and K Homology domain, type 1-containing protein [Strongyloides ratti]